MLPSFHQNIELACLDNYGLQTVQVQCMRQGAWCWCTGMTQRDGMEREVGGMFKMGNTYTPMVDSSQCMAKPL